jgi:hypothetical protein
MNKVIEAIDAALYDTALWLWLIPKTLWIVILRPAWFINYTNAELSKPTEERFNDYMPPVLFLIVSGVLPLAVFVDSLAAFWLKQHPNDLLRHIVERPWEVKLLFAAVSVASGPMSFAISIQLFRCEPLGRSELRLVFLPQAYLWGTCYGSAFVIGLGTVMAGFPREAPLLIIVAGIWLGMAEEKVIAMYFGDSRWKTRRKRAMVLTVAFVLFFLFEFTMLNVILFGLGGVPEWMLRRPFVQHP